MLIAFLLVGTVLLTIWIFARFNTYKPTIKRVRLTVNHPIDNRLNILHLSDLHMEKLSISSTALLNRLQQESIDLIALTGDYLDTKPMRDRFLQYIDALSTLKPRYGMFAVFGNHDYVIASHIPELRKEMERRSCTVLQNENYSILIGDQKLNIIGIDDYFTGRSDLTRSYENLEPGINLVLTHDPNIVLEMKDYPFDYLLSGHFHGGQIHWPKPYHLRKMGRLPHLNIFRGLHYHNNRAFYISEGLGQTAFRMRLRSRPEITFHNIGGFDA